MSMDVNLHRLPDKVIYCPKFSVPLAAVRWHLQSTDSAAIPSKQRKDSLPSSETHTLEIRYFISKTKVFDTKVFQYQLISLTMT